MTCTFFGHKDATESIYESLKEAITTLMNEGFNDFLVGNNGNFDYMVQKVLIELMKKGYNINLTVILSRIDEKTLFADSSLSLFPEELETSLPKYAISKRNEWMIRNSVVAMTYVNHSFSNAYKWQEKARRKGLRIISLGNQS